FGGEDEDVDGWDGRAVRKRGAGGEGGDERGGSGGFAIADVAAEDGKRAGGDPAGPKPGEGVFRDVGEAGGIEAMTSIARTGRGGRVVCDGLFDLVEVVAHPGGEAVGEVGDVHGVGAFPMR